MNMGSNKYDKMNTRRINLKLNIRTDADIIARLEKEDNMQSYIKSLIRQDTQYHIKPEYLPLWGDDATEETVLTGDDVETICRGWEKPVSEILDQLIPID